MARTEVMSIREFMNKGKETEVKVLSIVDKKEAFNIGMIGGITTSLLPFAPINSLAAQESLPVVALNNGEMYTKMVHAFDPLVSLIQALAYPVAMVVVLGGALFVMIGNKEKGFTMMQGAGLGYVLVQMTPMVLQILVDAMKTV